MSFFKIFTYYQNNQHQFNKILNLTLYDKFQNNRSKDNAQREKERQKAKSKRQSSFPTQYSARFILHLQLENTQNMYQKT